MAGFIIKGGIFAMPVRTKAEYKAVLREIEALFDDGVSQKT